MSKVIVRLSILTLVVYVYSQSSLSNPNDSGVFERLLPDLLEFLEYLGANLAGNVAFRGLYKAIESAIENLKERGILTAEEKTEQQAEQQAEKEAERIAEQEAERLAEESAERTAQQIAIKEAEAIRVATLTTKVKGIIGNLLTGPWSWALLGVETSLYAGLGLDPSMFSPCKEGEVDLANLPAWAQGLIGAFPLIGDLFTLVGGLLCFRETCPDGMENNGGLCYSPCRDGYKSDNATMCYKQYGDAWENKTGIEAPTITSITKHILTNTGVPYSKCADGMEQDGLLCYEPCKAGYTGVGPVCWANVTTIGNGVGTIPQKGSCDNGQRDDGTSCWEDWKAHCRLTFLSLVDDSCFSGCGCIKKTLFDRQYCGDNQELNGALCCDKCPEGMERVPGMPNQCRTIGDISYTRGVGDCMKCAENQTEDSAGLCYAQAPEGYEKQSLGLLSQKCPEGSTDFGVGCMRESYNRGAGQIGLKIYMKERESYYGNDPNSVPF